MDFSVQKLKDFRYARILGLEDAYKGCKDMMQ